MELQSVCSWHLGSKNILHNRLSSQQIVSTPFPVWDIRIRDQRVRYGNASTLCLMRGFKRRINDSYLPNLRIRTITGASSSNQDEKLISPGRRISNVPANAFDRSEPFRGKSGSVSFYGLTHQLVEEGKLVSSPFKEGTGSLLWVLAPIALISSLLLPPFFLSNAVDTVLKDEILAEIVASFSSEAMFYIGLAVFLLVTDHVQRPYLDFSPKRWGLITGLKGYITSAFFTMGFKVFAPLFAVYVTWPVLGLPAVVAVAPFLLGCVAQLAFETYLDKRGSSCWPLVTIIFEVYRLYQLSKAAHFIERLMFSMKGAAVSPELLERSGALVGMLVSFQILGVVCLWSLMTFLLRLFPSRPVAENY